MPGEPGSACRSIGLGRENRKPVVAVKRYHLYVKVRDQWQRLSTVEAVTHAAAFQGAMLILKPEHDALTIRFEQEESPQPAPR